MTLHRRRLFGLASAAALAISAFGLGASDAAAQEVTLRLHQFLPAQANVPKHILDVWADNVEKDSGGRIKIQRFPAMQLGGKPPELIDQMNFGVADIIWTVSGYTPGRFPRTEVFELPFTMTNAEAVSRAYWELAEETMMDADFKEFHPLGLWVHGPGNIHSKTPIAKISDLNGVRLRAPTRMTNVLFTTLGASTIGMPVPAVPEALSKGVIDATVIPWEVVGALKVHELVDHHTTFGDATLYTTTFIFAINKEKYESLPDDLKAAIDKNSGLEFSAFAGRTMQEDDGPERAKAEARGNTIVDLTPEQVEEWRAASAAIVDQWVAEMDANGLDGTALLARAKELIEKHTAAQ